MKQPSRPPLPPRPSSPFRCFYCLKVALYHVGKFNVCRDHKEAAVQIRKGVDAKYYSTRANRYEELERERRKREMART